MPRALSSNAVREALAEHSTDAFLMLVEFTYPATGETFRVALNTEDVTSGGHAYTATYFEVTLPETSDRAPQGCQITVDNVDLRMIDLLRSIVTPLSVTIRVVLASSPDVIEMELADLVLREVTWNAQTITGTLVSEDPLNQKFPGHDYEPRTFQGIF